MLTTPTTGTAADAVGRAPADAADAAATVVANGRRRRRHGAGVPFDREELERSGWRTTLEYRENHVRRRDGRLDHLEVVWRAEAERTLGDGSVLVVAASAHSVSTAWSALRREADLAARRTRSEQRDVATFGRSRRARAERKRQHASQ